MNIPQQQHTRIHGLSVIIPAYNEEKRIGPTLEDTITYCLGNIVDFEIIVVDDGSTDNTTTIVSSYQEQGVRLLRVAKNTGKGNAVKVGILDAKKPFIVFMDADGATNIREIEKLFPVLIQQNAQMVMGTRKTKTAHVLKQQSFIRRFMGAFFTFLSQVVTQTSFTDYMCGFKLFRADTAKIMAQLQTSQRFTFDTEYLCIARQRNLKVIELPITWEDKEGSKVRTVSDTASSLGDLTRIFFYSVVGRYR